MLDAPEWAGELLWTLLVNVPLNRWVVIQVKGDQQPRVTAYEDEGAAVSIALRDGGVVLRTPDRWPPLKEAAGSTSAPNMTG